MLYQILQMEPWMKNKVETPYNLKIKTKWWLNDQLTISIYSFFITMCTCWLCNWWSQISCTFLPMLYIKAYCWFITLSLQGFVHLALQSRLPIVPMVLTGTHLAWQKGSLHVRLAPLTVKYLPPISTTDWTADKIDDYIKMLHDLYVKHLPESQRPLVL